MPRPRTFSTSDRPSSAGEAPPSEAPEDLLARYHGTRRFSEDLARPLAPEDQVVQSMEDVSPTKWHLAHTSWFFETFLLEPGLEGYEPLDRRYAYLFNSYYVQAGERHCRDQRGYISRPTVAEVGEYRRHVDLAMERLLAGGSRLDPETAALVELGINHEQQHQELMLTDIKHVFSVNPLRPAYAPVRPPGAEEPPAGGSVGSPEGAESTVGPVRWVEHEGGVQWIGHPGRGAGFAYDNEGPRHRVFLEPFQVADRLVTCGEYLAFMDDGGYARPELWLSAGWATVQEQGWTEPFYWERKAGRWFLFTLAGMREVDPVEPVCHLSYFEADAFARWAGARLPTEAEWEIAAAGLPPEGNTVETGRLHPAPDGRHSTKGVPRQLFGDVWEWTGSQYSPYPGFRPAEGAVGEYNGKFMCNQFVLRGGSCVTSRSHLRATYRNFFPPEACWQFTGLRLARGLG